MTNKTSSIANTESVTQEGEVALPSASHIGTIHHIKDVQAQQFGVIGDARVTGVAQGILNYDSETMVWQDGPSLALMVPNLVKWVIITCVWIASLVWIAPSSIEAAPVSKDEVLATQDAQDKKPVKLTRAQMVAKEREAEREAAAAKQRESETRKVAKENADREEMFTWVLYAGLVVLGIKALGFLLRALQLRFTRYSMTSQRLKVATGLLSRKISTYELHKLNASHIDAPLTLRLFGRANVYVGVWLYAVSNPEVVRDLVRNAGQIEASRVEKANWR